MGFFPAIAQLFGGIFMALAAVLVNVFGRQIALRALVVAQVLIALGVFIGVLRTLLLTIVYSVPSWLSVSWSWVMPSNFVPCFVAIAGTYLARWVYDTTSNILFKSI